MIMKQYKMIWGKRPLYFVENGFIHTYIGFGVIDRGTNVLQVRPTTLCPMNCIFCSVDAGKYSWNRWAEYIVELNTILKSVKKITRYKGGGIEALIDTIGEALTYPWITDLVERLREEPSISSIAIETHGGMLNKKLIDRLEEAGLDRVNLSIDTFNKEKARFLYRVKWYDPDKVKKYAEYIVKETDIDLHITPLWIPGINDKDIEEIVKWAYRIGAGKKWPPVTIQKYNVHKYGRKIPGVKPVSWKSFWQWIKDFERKTGYRVSWSMDEWRMYYTRKYPCPYKRGDKVFVETISRGVFRGEYLGIINDHEDVLVTAIGRHLGIGRKYYGTVIEDKDCLLIVKTIKELHT